ncbi:DUF4388 domain-containing protein [Archangium sp.]|uniref:J domain-containing protein n=1 Tax=Archangium sp. TaxID=1872627 RepID=UPI00389B2A90
MAEGEVRQYFVRNEQGAIWGPLALPTIELLIDNGIIQGRLQVSEDGINFAFPGRFPHIRDAFPREMWGDVVPPGPSAPASPPAPAAPPMAGPGAVPRPPGAAVTRPPIPGAGIPVVGPGVAVTRPPVPGAGVPVAGPGAIARPPGPGAGVPVAGPGAVTRPPVPGAGVPVAGPGAVTRPPVPGAGVPIAGPGVAVTRPPVPGAGVPVASPGVAVTRPPVPGAGVPVASPGAVARPAAPHPGAVPPSAPAAAPRPPPPTTPAAAPARPSMTGVPSQQPAPAPSSDAPPPSSGQLEAHSPVHLYGLIAAGNHTGLLTISLPDCAVSIHFRKGNPEFIDSSHPEDALGSWLLQAKLVTPEQLQQAESSKSRFGGEVLAALFGLGLLQPATAFTQLAHRAQSILLKGLRADSGSFTFEPKELPAAKAMPLGNKWALLSELVRRIPTADLRRWLQPVLPLPVMKANGRVATGDLRLTPHEVRVLALIDGVRSLGQLLNDVPQDADHLLRIAFLLKELDAVSFAAATRTAPPPTAAAPQAPRPATTQPGVAQAGVTPQAARPATTQPGVAHAGVTPQAAAPKPAVPPPASAPQAAAPKPAAPPPASAPQAPRPAAPASAAPTAKPAAPAAAAKPAAPAAASGSAPGAAEIPALRELAEKLKDQNHFERLSLGADTNGPAVKIAYFKLAKQYHPDTLPPGAPPELEKLKADIFAYIGEAYRTLSDDKGRAAYLDELKSGGKQEAQVDVEAILKSEELFRKAGHYIKARKFAEAAKLLDEAIELNSQEPEFYAWRGYARFFTFEDKKTGYNEAYKDLQACLKQNEKVASAHYFLGAIAKLCGDQSGAMKHFQRTVELQPNHIDAQREIRMAQQKK